MATGSRTVRIDGHGGPAAHAYTPKSCGCAHPAVLSQQGVKTPDAGKSHIVNVAKK